MDKLQEICARKAAHVALKKAETPLSELRARIHDAPAPRGFIKALKLKPQSHPALIAEIKKASPSKGVIRDDFDPANLAQSYMHGGAACLSVLTDEPYFQGHDTFLGQARGACALPALRKDFMIDEYQIYESRIMGADCILLIVAALNDNQLKSLYNSSLELEMDVLIEVHDRAELDRALALNPAMIGVNSRNLKTLQVDTATAFDLAQHMPDDVLRVAESGITDHDSLVALQTAGYDAFLVGESLMRQDDVTAATRRLLGLSAHS